MTSRSNNPKSHERSISESQPSQDRAQKNRGVYESFLKTIVEFNKKHNTPIQEQPQIDGRPLNLYTLYGYVLKAGGSEAVDENAHWLHIATALGFPGQGHAVSDIHRRCLREYEKEWLAKRRASQPRLTQDLSDKTMVSSNDLASSASYSKELRVSYTPEHPTTESSNDDEIHGIAAAKNPYKPIRRTLDTFVGINPHTASMIGKDATKLRPYPTFQELGRLDIQGIARSIESYLPAEVGNALDILTVIAGDRRWGLPLIHCGDLLEVLVECLSDSLAYISCENTCSIVKYSELVFDALHSSSRYKESWLLSDTNFDHESAVQRIMSIMTILRNLAFTEINQEPIANTNQLLSTLSTGIIAFCTIERTAVIPDTLALDFAKDCVTLLSLIGGFVVLDDQEQFSVIFRFLLSFAPLSTPVTVYDVSALLALNPYLAPAIDATAKIFSRDEPNRRLCEDFLSIGSSVHTWSHSTNLMMLATAILPNDLTDGSIHTISKRLPLLQHSIIVAEFAADMTPVSGEIPARWTDETMTCCLRLMVLWKSMSRIMLPVSGMTETESTAMKRRIIAVINLLFSKTGSNAPVGARGSKRLWSELKTLIQFAEAEFAIF
ncbi:Putative uncharacterized protein [Taphrina deformans PYCC 5710]|uniref:ARID domain-containing protein n=1 Tax=Taphrina deformans (strain PYCC 5710 / ATCC 11124 / CBS 356.35 / IMI 108563 / JCM 9778 / NBRC 8474) TaxID=1097556 RepID=R4X6U3_TAPDE|nr:Putative uncharacterized protein [Taphrina deformans PYCC 5710]|eukprot:CCG80666.1 Putative uncharacterized protein [Taphrina deformans PYCC 5710]